MRYHTPWQWDPTKGEYRVFEEQAAGAGEINASEAFNNRTIFLLGISGFVGKVLLAMLLDRFPDVNHLVIQVRRKKNASGEQRFYSEILTSPPMRAVVERLGGAETLRKKVTIVEGDVNEPLCGLTPEALDRIQGKVDVIVNLAGLVDFTPPLNESLIPNVYGVRHLIDLSLRLNTKLVHVSTAYVAGKQNGRISEDWPIYGYYPNRNKPGNGRPFNLEEELAWCERFIEETRADTALSTRDIKEKLRRGGMERAESWGWTNTYTYTKSMGEQIIASTPGLTYAIVRPAIVESSREFPFPGWNEGLTTSAPLVLMGGEGVKAWPVRRDGPLEIIPADIVAAGILIITAAILCGKQRPVYHLATADENPAMLPRLVTFIGMHARFKHKHKKGGSRLGNLWKAYVDTRIVSVEQLASRRARLQRGLDVIHAALTFLKTLVGPARIDPYLKDLRLTRRQIRQQEDTLDMFLPFMVYNSFIFETRNIREAVNMLTSADRKRLQWNPELIDWADYWVNVHTKGIERWIRPTFTIERKAS